MSNGNPSYSQTILVHSSFGLYGRTDDYIWQILRLDKKLKEEEEEEGSISQNWKRKKK